MNSVGKWEIELRLWQQLAYDKFFNLAKNDFTLVATPGSGKTLWSLRICHELFRTQHIDRVVVVCPTEHIKKQWATAAHKCGITLDPVWINDPAGESPDNHGVAVTYHQVASNPGVHRSLCRRDTLVIFDEIHHAGDNLAWGNSIRHAFERAKRRLLISGTPFRSDNNPIPFITYEDGKSKSDFDYGYGAALANDVCRSVFFPSWEGRMSWMSGYDMMTATFRDELSKRQNSERLDTALNPEGDWLKTVINEANQKLTELRADDHPNAAGLIIAKDQSHAKAISKIVASYTGEEPAVAISEDPGASTVIENFAQSNRRWIVAVRMVSEGVDIPRLRVGVYATNIQTEMYFRQAVGRFVRVDNERDDQTAYLFIPADEILKSLAQTIKDEREHQIKEQIENLKVERKKSVQDSLQMPFSAFISASNPTPDDLIFDQQTIGPEELRFAEELKRKQGIPAKFPTPWVALVIRGVGAATSPQSHAESTPIPPRPIDPPAWQQKKALRRIIAKMVGHLAAISGDEHKHINDALWRITEAPVHKRTVEQLEKCITYLQTWINGASNGR